MLIIAKLNHVCGANYANYVYPYRWKKEERAIQ